MTRTWYDMRGRTFDSREVIERIEEIEAELDPESDARPDPEDAEALADELRILRIIRRLRRAIMKEAIA